MNSSKLHKGKAAMLNFVSRLTTPSTGVQIQPVFFTEADRLDLLMELDISGYNPLKMVDWLGTTRKESFWTFPAGEAIEPQYNPAQQIYMTEVWREHYRGWEGSPEAAPHLLNHFYRDFVVALYSNRNDNTRTGSEAGWGRDGDGSVIDFYRPMDMALNWVAEQLPILRVLHELDQPAYEYAPASVASVRTAVSKAARHGSNPTPFDEWVFAWTQFHVRYFVKKALDLKPRGDASTSSNMGDVDLRPSASPEDA